jgi:hypothetical protein
VKCLLYFALQQDIDLNTFPGWLAEHKIARWVYAGDDSTWKVRAEFFIPKTVERVSLAAELDRVSWTFRTPYLDLIGKLSNINKSPEWWGSDVASKNSYTQLYTRICLLAVCRSLIDRDPDTDMVFVCSSMALCHELINHAEEKKIRCHKVPVSRSGLFISATASAIRDGLESVLRWLPPFPAIGNHVELYRRLLETRNDYRCRVLGSRILSGLPEFTGKKVILLFTWVDRRNFTPEGQYRDPHFGPLPAELKKRGYTIIFVPRILFTIPYAEAVDLLLKTGEQFLFPEQLVDGNDVRSCEQRSKQFQPVFPEGLSLGSLPVLSLVKEQHERYRKTLSETLLYEYFIRHCAERGLQPQQIIHTCEGHCWEQVLKGAVQQYMPATKVVGYDNLTFSRLALSMFPSKDELAIRPLPDRIVTNGPLYYEVLKSEGLPGERISSGCALRHTYLWEPAGTVPSRNKDPADRIRVLAATGITFGESVELAASATQAFGGDNAYELLIKCHPMINPEQVKPFLGSWGAGKNIRFVSEPLDVLFPQVDVLLYTYTASSLEALKFGVYPIIVRSDNVLTPDHLDAAPDIRGCATSPEEIRAEVEKFVRTTPEEKRAYRARSLDILKRALAPVTESCIDSFIIE